MPKNFLEYLSESKEIIGSPAEAIRSFKPKDSLNSKLWNNETLRKNIKDDLIEIAKDFYDSLEVNAPLLDIQLLGSSANYNWSKFSDIDLHIVIDFSKVDENEKLLRNYFDAAKRVWNSQHDIKIAGYPVEVYIQDINDKPESSGTYSMMQNEWINKPKPGEFKLNSHEVKKKSADLISEINGVLKSKDASQLSDLKKKIKQLRNAGLSSGGEYSVENLVFKTLRRSGYLDKISMEQTSLYDKSKSI